jgi:hypothetical protein
MLCRVLKLGYQGSRVDGRWGETEEEGQGDRLYRRRAAGPCARLLEFQGETLPATGRSEGVIELGEGEYAFVGGMRGMVSRWR